MKISEIPKFDEKYRSGYLLLGLVSVFTLTATFLVSNLNLAFAWKTIVFLAITFSYLVFCLFLYFRQTRIVETVGVFDRDAEEKLLALEEASEFFGASLKPAEMFRLVSSRVNELIPFAACALLLPDRAGLVSSGGLQIRHAVGENAEKLAGLQMPAESGLAGRAFAHGEIQSATNLTAERELVPPAALAGLNSAIAIPLKNEGQAFGVLALYAGREKGFGKKSWQMIEAVGERVAPLILGSIAYERNLQNALTDALTDLPNERAFFLVLENQIAESQRYREQRPLTVLSIDIKNFDEINQRYGHARGDQILAYAARLIKGQLRQMDFLARAAGDEFMAVLPTASEEITQIIIGRIKKAFDSSPFELTRGERESVKLNFGAASFLKDGETAQELLRVAGLRKRMTKKSAKGSVLWFPREYVN